MMKKAFESLRSANMGYGSTLPANGKRRHSSWVSPTRPCNSSGPMPIDTTRTEMFEKHGAYHMSSLMEHNADYKPCENPNDRVRRWQMPGRHQRAIDSHRAEAQPKGCSRGCPRYFASLHFT